MILDRSAPDPSRGLRQAAVGGFATHRLISFATADVFPEAYAGNAQLRTLQRRVKAWRAERARELIMGRRRGPIDVPDKAPAKA
jgi:hypothetical protein